MEAALAESQARSQKCEREYITLRDSLKGLVESFKSDQDSLREEMRKREEKMRREAEEVRKKYVRLVDEVKKDREADGRSLGEVVKLKEESERIRKEIEERLRGEVQKLRAEVDRSNRESEGAIQTAKCVFLLCDETIAHSWLSQKPVRGACSPAQADARQRLSCNGTRTGLVIHVQTTTYTPHGRFVRFQRSQRWIMTYLHYTHSLRPRSPPTYPPNAYSLVQHHVVLLSALSLLCIAVNTYRSRTRTQVRGRLNCVGPLRR